ncbi:hypothetical protein [Anaerobutyricum soehngenii]|uniref:hypothetical protein n=1 Tax=Anaerobutyricum soehngenii TaxID=105843 RepID=UPI0032C17058
MFKMLIRILNTLRSRIWDMIVFLFSVFWLQKGGEKAEDYCLLGRCIIQKIIFSL